MLHGEGQPLVSSKTPLTQVPVQARITTSTDSLTSSFCQECDISKTHLIQKIWTRLSAMPTIAEKMDGRLAQGLAAIDNETLPAAMLAKVSLEASKLKHHLPPQSADLRQLLSLLASHTKAAWSRAEKRDQAAQLTQRLDYLKQPDSIIRQKVKAGVFASEKLGPVKGKLKAHYEHKTTLFADDEGLIYDKASNGGLVGAKVSGGIKLDKSKLKLGASATGGYAKQAIKEYDSLEQYCSQEAHKHGWARRCQHTEHVPWLKKKAIQAGQYASEHYRINLGSELSAYSVHQQAATYSTSQFNTLLADVLNIHDTKVITPQQQHPLKTRGYANVYSGELNADAHVSLFEGEAGYEYKHYDIHKFPRSSLFDLVIKEPHKIQDIPSQWTRLGKDLLKEASGANDQQKLVNAIESLQEKAQTYFAIVQGRDTNADGAFGAGSKNPKYEIETTLGSRGRHQTLVILQASIAWLGAQAAIRTDWSDAKDAAKKANELISKPPITHSYKKIQDLTSFKHQLFLDIKEHSFQIDSKLAVFEGKIAVSKRHWTHPNRLRQGNFLDLNFTLGAELSAHELAHYIQEAAKKAGGEIAQVTKSLSATDFSGINAGIEGTQTWTIRWYKPDQQEDGESQTQWKKQFVRISRTTGVDVELPMAIPIGTAKIGPEILLATSNTQTMSEKIGTEDLSYPLLRYNRMHKQDHTDNQWHAFVDKHKSEFSEIFSQIALGNTGLKQELTDIVNEAKSHLAKSESSVGKEIDNWCKAQSDNHLYLNNSNTQVDAELTKLIASSKRYQEIKCFPSTSKPELAAAFDCAEKALTTLFALQHLSWYSDYKSNYKPVLFSKNGAQTLRSQIKQAAHIG